jgi:hypothetical protein
MFIDAGTSQSVASPDFFFSLACSVLTTLRIDCSSIDAARLCKRIKLVHENDARDIRCGFCFVDAFNVGEGDAGGFSI